jgi:tetratricopeptide (TPR) repeat protein
MNGLSVYSKRSFSRPSRSCAVTLGDIARIMTGKGQVDGVLKLQEESLQVNKSLGNLDGIASALYDLALIYLDKKDFQKAYEHLSQSYEILLNNWSP